MSRVFKDKGQKGQTDKARCTNNIPTPNLSLFKIKDVFSLHTHLFECFKMQKSSHELPFISGKEIQREYSNEYLEISFRECGPMVRFPLRPGDMEVKLLEPRSLHQ